MPATELDASAADATNATKRCGPARLKDTWPVLAVPEELTIWELEVEDKTVNWLLLPGTRLATPFTFTSTGTVTDEDPFRGTLGTVTIMSVPLQLVTVAVTPPTVTVLVPCTPPK
jgi:hypothetical protein